MIINKGGSIWGSIVIRGGPYSRSFNPHLAVFFGKYSKDKGAKGLFLKVPWAQNAYYFLVSISLKVKTFFKRTPPANPNCTSIVKIKLLGFIYHRFKIVTKKDGLTRVYYKFPFAKTQCKEWSIK